MLEWFCHVENDFIIRMGLNISVLKKCREMKENIPLSDTNKKNIFILLPLNDFVGCSTSLYIWGRRSKSYLNES